MKEKLPYPCYGLECLKCKNWYYDNIDCGGSAFFDQELIKRKQLEINLSLFIKMLIDPSLTKEKKIKLQHCFPEYVKIIQGEEQK